MSTDRPGPGLRAAVIGASGIGKHHAKWFHLAGCDVVAFCGTSPESTGTTAEALGRLFGFSGRTYCSPDQMLAAEKPDLVSVCSPPQLHYEHALAALHAGAHVMCEKPLVWGEVADLDRLLSQGRQLVEAARAADRILAVNTQYAAAAEAYRHELGLAVEPIGSFFMRMESRGTKQGRGYEDIWVDLGSHPISVLMAFLPDGEPSFASASCVVRQNEVAAELDYRSPEGVCHAILETGNTPPDQPIVRRFGVNGRLVDYEGRNDESGVFCAYLRGGDREVKATDFVQTSLTRFIAAAAGATAAPLATGADGVRNLEIQLRLLAMARRA